MEAKVMPKGFQESSREKANSTQKVPIALGLSLPLTWNAGVKEGASATIFNHGAAMSLEALCSGWQSSHTEEPRPLMRPWNCHTAPKLLLEKVSSEWFCHCSQRSVTSSHVQFLMDSLSEKP